MKGLFSILALVCLISPTVVLGEPAFCMVSLVTNREFLINIPSEESRSIIVDYHFDQYSNPLVVQESFELDERYHSEEEIKDFFENTKNISKRALEVAFKSEKPMIMGEYRLFYVVKYIEVGSYKHKEVRLDIPLSFVDVQSKVNLIVGNASGAMGLIDETKIGVEQEEANELEFSLSYMIPRTRYNVLIAEGQVDADVDWNSIRFPIPEGQKELYPVTLKYKKDGKSGEIRRFVYIQRPANLNLTTLDSFMTQNAVWDQGELVAFTNSLVNVAFREEDFETDIHPIYCTKLYCSSQGSCQKIEPFFKKCNCNKGFEGVRCTLKTGQEALVKKMFLGILRAISTGKAHKTSASDAAEIVSQLASIHTIVDYGIIEEELKLIAMIAPSARAKGLVDPLTTSLKSICARLTNLALTVKFKHTEKEEFERIGKIEHKFDEQLITIARRMGVEEKTFKQITNYVKRNMVGPSAKDKLVEWFKNIGKGNKDEPEFS